MAARVGTRAIVTGFDDDDDYVNVRWIGDSNGQMDGGYDKPYFKLIRREESNVFKRDARVVKCRPYREDKYCRYGGDASAVPIGTEGVITSKEGTDRFQVQFDNKVSWSLDVSEIKLIGDTSIMNTTIAKLFKVTEEAMLVNKHLGHQIKENEVAIVLFTGKEKALLAAAQKIEDENNASKLAETLKAIEGAIKK